MHEKRIENHWNFAHCVRSGEMKVFSFSLGACSRRSLAFSKRIIKWFLCRWAALFAALVMNYNDVELIEFRGKFVQELTNFMFHKALRWFHPLYVGEDNLNVVGSSFPRIQHQQQERKRFRSHTKERKCDVHAIRIQL